MSRQEANPFFIEDLSLRGVDDVTVAILAVGDTAGWLRKGNNLPTESSVAFCEFSELNERLLERLCPTVVISPALSHEFDCIDLAQLLSRLGFKGRYRAVSRELPNPEMVEREIRSLCGDLDFGILVAS